MSEVTAPMAGEKKEEKGMVCENCGMCMCKTCGVITGLLVLVSGVVMLLAGLGNLNAMTATVVGGAALALAGLSFVVHALKMCPMCK